MSENPVRWKFSRHVEICRYYVRELILNGFLKLVPSRTHKMVADALTKSSVPSFRWAQSDNDWSCFLHRSTPTWSRRLILSADFERCVFPIFRLVVYIFFSPLVRYVGWFWAAFFMIFFSCFHNSLLFWFAQYCLWWWWFLLSLLLEK